MSYDGQVHKKDGYRQRNVRQLGRPIRPSDNRGKCHMDEKEDSMLVKRIATCIHLSLTVSQ